MRHKKRMYPPIAKCEDCPDHIPPLHSIDTSTPEVSSSVMFTGHSWCVKFEQLIELKPEQLFPDFCELEEIDDKPSIKVVDIHDYD